eukprot:m.17262 g.17262  ORF g.17262 m.17262 type:complete len:342 (+) comp5963_c0_seq1:199-1224(+)
MDSVAKTDKSRTTVSGIAEKIQDAAFLDVAFAMDCTGSMGSYIKSAQESIATIAQQVVTHEKADCRFALVEYRDHPPQDSTFVTRVHPFTASLPDMRKNLDQCRAQGGGDEPEAVAAALEDCLKLDWRAQATKIVVLISDAPPHGLGQGHDGFPNGCPLGNDPITTCRNMAENEITLYCIGCEPSINKYRDFFEGMCHITGGQYCGLGKASGLTDVIVGGAREEMGLKKLMRDVDAEIDALGERTTEEEQTRIVYEKMQNHKTTHLLRGGKENKASPLARKMKETSNLFEASSLWRSEAKTAAPPPSGAAASYECLSAPVTMEQCNRMVSKSRAKKGWWGS